MERTWWIPIAGVIFFVFGVEAIRRWCPSWIAGPIVYLFWGRDIDEDEKKKPPPLGDE